MIAKKVFLLFTLMVITACSGIKMITPEDIYSSGFIKKFEGIQNIFRDGDKVTALNKLKVIPDQTLRPDEIGKKYNLIGVIYFSNKDFDKAIGNFKIAEKSVKLDKTLKSQVYLNLASAHFKKEQLTLVLNYLKDIEGSLFDKNEKQKLYKLHLYVGKRLNQPKNIVEGLIGVAPVMTTFSEVENMRNKDLLIDNFRKLSESQRLYMLDRFYSKDSVLVAYLAKEEALQRYFVGNKTGSQDVLDWMESKYPSNADVSKFIADFKHRVENYSKIDIGAIGVVLPITGKKDRFGKKALEGIDSVLNIRKQKIVGTKIYIRDNQDNPQVAKKMIRDLVQKQNVSVIIGGLFSSTAAEEYLEAKKYGVLYISLSPVFIPKSQKNKLLIEIPGSVESQIQAVMSPKFLKKFGNRVGIIYPDNKVGHSYVDELWRRQDQGTIKINAVHSFKRGTKDFRDVLSNMLALKYIRERGEEYSKWRAIYKLEKRRKGSVRRVQHLKPIVDFDWVFAPVLPKDAVQIVPSFSYLDAKSLQFVGVPSWSSSKIKREQASLGTIYYVGDDPKDFDLSFTDRFIARNGKRPRLIETMAYEAMKVALDLIEMGKIEKRDDLESQMTSIPLLRGLTGNWSLKEDIWIKDMDLMRINSDGTMKAPL